MSGRFLLLQLLALGFAEVGLACWCNFSAYPAPCAAWNKTDAVFVGVVKYASPTYEEMLSQRPKPVSPFRSFRFSVEEDFSQLGVEEIEVRTASLPGACGISFKPGERYLVYASRREPETLSTSICSRTKSLRDGRADLDLKYLRSLRKSGDRGVVWGFVVWSRDGEFDREAKAVRVILSGVGGTREALTDQLGLYQFDELSPGRYRVELPDSPKQWRDASVGQLGCEQFDFMLRK